MTEFSETENWIHFKNTQGVHFSCCRFCPSQEKFPNITRYFDCPGTPIVFPRQLREACLTAEIFSRDNEHNNVVRVALQPSRDRKPAVLRIRGEGSMGRYQQVYKIEYDGPLISCGIGPLRLAELLQRFSRFEISDKRLTAIGDKFVYVLALGIEDRDQDKVATECRSTILRLSARTLSAFPTKHRGSTQG